MFSFCTMFDCSLFAVTMCSEAPPMSKDHLMVLGHDVNLGIPGAVNGAIIIIGAIMCFWVKTLCLGFHLHFLNKLLGYLFLLFSCIVSLEHFCVYAKTFLLFVSFFACYANIVVLDKGAALFRWNLSLC